MEKNKNMEQFISFFKKELFPIIQDEEGKGIDKFKKIVEERKAEVEANILKREQIKLRRELEKVRRELEKEIEVMLNHNLVFNQNKDQGFDKEIEESIFFEDVVNLKYDLEITFSDANVKKKYDTTINKGRYFTQSRKAIEYSKSSTDNVTKIA